MGTHFTSNMSQSDRVKWMYKVKKNTEKEIKKHKTKLMAKGYNQKINIDYDEVFTPVARLEIIMLIIFLVAHI